MARDTPSSDFATLYEPVAPALRAWAELRCRGPLGRAIDADDLVQEVCVEGLAALDRFDPERGAFRPWLFGVATRVASAALRRMARRDAAARIAPLGALHTEPLAQATTISRRVRRSESLERFLAAVADLDETDRALVMHRGLEGLPHDDVAALLDLTPDAAGKRWQRLRRRLGALPAARDLLEDLGGG